MIATSERASALADILWELLEPHVGQLTAEEAAKLFDLLEDYPDDWPDFWCSATEGSRKLVAEAVHIVGLLTNEDCDLACEVFQNYHAKVGGVAE